MAMQWNKIEKVHGEKQTAVNYLLTYSGISSMLRGVPTSYEETQWPDGKVGCDTVNCTDRWGGSLESLLYK